MIQAKLVIVLGAGIAVALASFLSYHHGKDVEESRWEAKWEKRERELADAQLLEVQQARKQEQDLRAEFNALDLEYKALEEEYARVAEEQDRRIDGLVDSNQRLRVSVRRQACPGVPPGGASPKLGERSDYESAELDPAAARSIVALTREGDRNTRERNLCVRAYQTLAERFNSAQQTTVPLTPDFSSVAGVRTGTGTPGATGTP